MKSFLFKISPFILILLINISIRYWVNFDHRYDFFIYKGEKNIENSIIIIGDSKTLAGIDQEEFLRNNIQIINLSSWGARPYDLEKAITHYNIENSTVFINVTSRIFLGNDSTSIESSPNKIYNLLNFPLHIKLIGFVKKNIQGRWEYQTEKCGSIKFNNLYRPYRNYLWKDDSTNYSKLLNDSLTNYFTTIKIKHLSHIVNHLGKNNTVVLMDLPERVEFDNLVRSYEQKIFEDISRQTGRKIWDFGIYPNELFYDSHHLNKIGRKQFSSELIQFIKSSKLYPTHHGSN